jgi:hypothetical protein
MSQVHLFQYFNDYIIKLDYYEAKILITGKNHQPWKECVYGTC